MLIKNTMKIIAIFVMAIILANCTSEEIAEESDFSSSSDASNIASPSSSSSFKSSSSVVLPSSSSSLVASSSSSSLEPSSSSVASSSSSSSEAEPSSSSLVPSSSSSSDDGSFIDARDGQTYNTVKIGNQVWMARNLDYDESGSLCYDNKDSNCEIYGRLYNWIIAMNLPENCISKSCISQVNVKHRGVCPVGWHVPSKDEWDVLRNYVIDSYAEDVEGMHLKATSGWDSDGNGLDTYGFAALPGGQGIRSFFAFDGSNGLWWSSSEWYSDVAYDIYMTDSGDGTYWGGNEKSRLHSVRCVRD